MLTRVPFGHDLDGRPAEAWRLRSASGMEAWFLEHGATLARLQVPGRAGVGDPVDVVLGFDALHGYQRPHPYLGAVIGRYANRIRDGRFVLDGATVQLACNDGANHLHGGPVGFDRRAWVAQPAEDAITFSLHSEDGDQGYPGALEAQVRYSFAPSALRIDYTARTDRPTPANLTQHAYFDLGDEGILDLELQLAASRVLPVDAALLPTGEVDAVAGTPFDFRRPVRLRDAIAALASTAARVEGFDHCFVLDGQAGHLREAATLRNPRTALSLTVLTDQPGLQLYTGNFLDGSLVGRRERAYARHAGLCLEAQRFPDGPNHPDWGDCILRPGELYRQVTELRFDYGKA